MIFDMSVKLTSIYENDNLKDLFAQSIENNRLLHSIILEGAYGTGKFTFAKEIAKAVCCQSDNKPCGVCESCRKTEQEIAVDISYYDIPEGKSEIPVEVIRNIREDTYTLPCENDYKFYIIKNSQAMNGNAQNAFLKILEEPPSYVYFILLCTNASLLLPTVRSRAPIFRLQSLEIPVMRGILQKNKTVSDFAQKSPDLFEHILQCSDGSLGYCIEHCTSAEDGDDFGLYEDARRFLELLVCKDRVDLAVFALNIPSDRNGLHRFLSLIRSGLRDLIAAKKTDCFDFMFFTQDCDLIQKSAFLNPLILDKALDYTEKAIDQNNSNGNISIIKTDYISKIGSICRR